MSRPRGGFLLWVRLPDGVDALALHRRARERGISVSPGPIFSPSGDFRHCLRLSAGHLWSERTEWALDELAEMIGVG